MRYIVKAAALVVLLALLAPTVVLAQDYITDAAKALQQASVYVAPDTEGTDKDTANVLQSRLKKDDNIILVMLPTDAEAKLGMDINTIAVSLSDKLGSQRIIGLAVGDNVVGYAPTLSAGVAADQMRRASSVSNNNPITALSTFTQNVHTWQAAHPQPKPSQPDLPKKGGGLPWYAWLGFGFAGFLAAVIVLFAIGITTAPANAERTRFKAPDPVKDLLTKIAKVREQIRDEELKGVLYQMCEHIERYFASSSKDEKRDAHFFRDRLTEVSEVLARYIDIQKSPLYYSEPRNELERGKKSIVKFSQYVLESIQRGHAAELVEYRVNTDILDAQLRR